MVCECNEFLQNYDVGKIIHEKGCVHAGEEWLEHNLLIIACTAIAIAFLQVRMAFTLTILVVLSLDSF